jgi:pimeloyl-ACP methyl ester carboxylesterase
MTTFVLIHGSWHDGSSWGSVIRHLESKQHTAHAPTIRGHGIGADRDVNHAQSVQSIVDYISMNDLNDFVLLGHSFAGTIIAKVAEQMPDRIRRLIFWNAFVPLDGNSMLDEVPPHYAEMFRQLAAASGDNTMMVPFPVWREAFMNDADDGLARSSYEKLTPEPFRPFTDKLDLVRFYSLDIPKSYLNCTDDTALPPGEWSWVPRFPARLGLCRLVQMPGSHEALFTNPVLLAEKIIEAGRD